MDEVGQQEWDTRVASLPGGSFLQSWGWGELHRELGVTLWRIVEDEGVALVIKRPVRFGKSWLYVPRGPLAATSNIYHRILDQVAELARTEDALFTRIEPAVPGGGAADLTHLQSHGWRRSAHAVQPINTLILDIAEKTEEQLLAAMHQKSRYNIRLAQRKGVQVRFTKDPQEIEHFIALAREVASRQPFQYHPDAYYRTMMEVLGQHGVELGIAEHDGNPVAVLILIRFHDTVTYIHGASSIKQRAVMGPHLLQWEAIKRAKEQGAAHYDFYGIAPAKAGPDHPWAGITRFKLGFSGRQVQYPYPLDYVRHSLWYAAYQVAHKLRTR